MNRKRHLEFHGLTAGGKQPPEYQIWSQIKARCFNKNHPKYKRYGGRGISMYPAWRDSFSAFFEAVGKRPEGGLLIDRIDNDGNYEPGNVRWATRITQARNTSTNKIVVYKGKEYVQSELAEKKGIERKRFQQRLDKGMSVEAAVSRPFRSDLKQASGDL